jgi:Tat protein translocase TatB subunit
MDFLGIGLWELLLILVVVLIVAGPGRIPGIARTLGKTVRAFKTASSKFTTAITSEIESSEVKSIITSNQVKPEPEHTADEPPAAPGGSQP